MKNFFILFSLILFTTQMYANSASKPITVQNAYSFKSAPNAKNGSVFLEIQNNTNSNINLIKAQSDISEHTELHTHVHSKDKMIMKAVDKIEIKANSTLSLKPFHEHIMLINLKKSIQKDTKISLKLFFDNGQNVSILLTDIKERNK